MQYLVVFGMPCCCNSLSCIGILVDVLLWTGGRPQRHERFAIPDNIFNADGVDEQEESIMECVPGTGKKRDNAGPPTDEENTEEEDEEVDDDKEEEEGEEEKILHKGASNGSNGDSTKKMDSVLAVLNEVTPRNPRPGDTLPDSMRLFKEQEIANGNCVNMKEEVRQVKIYCMTVLFTIVKFATPKMLVFSVKREGMTKEEKYNPVGLISRAVIDKFARNRTDEFSWWCEVQGGILQHFSRRRGTFTEAVKKAVMGKC